jgi:putative zinc finger protein
MNCKEVERFLPLFAGGDLAERLEQPISRHLQSCASCALVARDYRQSAELLQQFAAPAFSDEVYAEIRRSVWRQIDAAPQRAWRFTIFGVRLRPPMIFATAAALFIAISAGIYFIRPAGSVPEPVAANSSGGNVQPVSRSVVDQPATRSSRSEGGSDRRQVDFGRSRRRLDRRRAPGRAPSLARNSPDAESSKGEAAPQVNSLVNTVEVLPGEKLLRMEMQTRNPNIRIIWFAQKERKSFAPNSKGT